METKLVCQFGPADFQVYINLMAGQVPHTPETKCDSSQRFPKILSVVLKS